MADPVADHERRKEAQLRACLNNDVRGHGITTGFERFRFVHQALPEVDWREIDNRRPLLSWEQARGRFVYQPDQLAVGRVNQLRR
jgi:hypothetical protein